MAAALSEAVLRELSVHERKVYLKTLDFEDRLSVPEEYSWQAFLSYENRLARQRLFVDNYRLHRQTPPVARAFLFYLGLDRKQCHSFFMQYRDTRRFYELFAEYVRNGAATSLQKRFVLAMDEAYGTLKYTSFMARQQFLETFQEPFIKLTEEELGCVNYRISKRKIADLKASIEALDNAITRAPWSGLRMLEADYATQPFMVRAACHDWLVSNMTERPKTQFPVHRYRNIVVPFYQDLDSVGKAMYQKLTANFKNPWSQTNSYYTGLLNEFRTRLTIWEDVQAKTVVYEFLNLSLNGTRYMEQQLGALTLDEADLSNTTTEAHEPSLIDKPHPIYTVEKLNSPSYRTIKEDLATGLTLPDSTPGEGLGFAFYLDTDPQHRYSFSRDNEACLTTECQVLDMMALHLEPSPLLASYLKAIKEANSKDQDVRDKFEARDEFLKKMALVDRHGTSEPEHARSTWLYFEILTQDEWKFVEHEQCRRLIAYWKFHRQALRREIDNVTFKSLRKWNSKRRKPIERRCEFDKLQKKRDRYRSEEQKKYQLNEQAFAHLRKFHLMDEMTWNKMTKRILDGPHISAKKQYEADENMRAHYKHYYEHTEKVLESLKVDVEPTLPNNKKDYMNSLFENMGLRAEYLTFGYDEDDDVEMRDAARES